MSGLNYALRVLKSVFRPEHELLEAYLESKNPQNSKELNYWIDQYEKYTKALDANKHTTMI
jgi:hypothetical protein